MTLYCLLSLWFLKSHIHDFIQSYKKKCEVHSRRVDHSQSVRKHMRIAGLDSFRKSSQEYRSHIFRVKAVCTKILYKGFVLN